MKTIPATAFALILLGLSVSPLAAEQFGLFTYEVIGGTTVTITDYPVSEVGPVVIPAEIDGKPVTSIVGIAFADFRDLRFANVSRDVPRRFLRLIVED